MFLFLAFLFFITNSYSAEIDLPDLERDYYHVFRIGPEYSVKSMTLEGDGMLTYSREEGTNIYSADNKLIMQIYETTKHAPIPKSPMDTFSLTINDTIYLDKLHPIYCDQIESLRFKFCGKVNLSICPLETTEISVENARISQLEILIYYMDQETASHCG